MPVPPERHWPSYFRGNNDLFNTKIGINLQNALDYQLKRYESRKSKNKVKYVKCSYFGSDIWYETVKPAWMKRKSDKIENTQGAKQLNRHVRWENKLHTEKSKPWFEPRTCWLWTTMLIASRWLCSSEIGSRCYALLSLVHPLYYCWNISFFFLFFTATTGLLFVCSDGFNKLR